MTTILKTAATLLAVASPLAAQRVTIQRATPAEVVAAVDSQLRGQGFKLESATDRAALFTLDRGMISQNRNSVVRIVHVFLELHLRFRQRQDGLDVTAYEEVVGDRRASLEFRQPVRSREELKSIQQLLDQVKTGLEARPAPSP